MAGGISDLRTFLLCVVARTPAAEFWFSMLWLEHQTPAGLTMAGTRTRSTGHTMYHGFLNLSRTVLHGWKNTRSHAAGVLVYGMMVGGFRSILI